MGGAGSRSSQIAYLPNPPNAKGVLLVKIQPVSAREEENLRKERTYVGQLEDLPEKPQTTRRFVGASSGPRSLALMIIASKSSMPSSTPSSASGHASPSARAGPSQPLTPPLAELPSRDHASMHALLN